MRTFASRGALRHCAIVLHFAAALDNETKDFVQKVAHETVRKFYGR
jgi:hypothetical protein